MWLPQRLMAELFQTTPDNIGLHLKNIYVEGELAEKATAEDFSVVQNKGGRAVRRTLKQLSLPGRVQHPASPINPRYRDFCGTRFLNIRLRMPFLK